MSVIIFRLLARFRTTELYSYHIKRNKSFQKDYAMDTNIKIPILLLSCKSMIKHSNFL